MVKVIEAAGYSCRATDILTGTDFLIQSEPWEGAIITNPPYSSLDIFVHKALKLASSQVAMLLPIGGLGGQNRYDGIWFPIPPAMIIVVARRMVVLGKMSQFNHVWAIWDKTRSGESIIRWEK